MFQNNIKVGLKYVILPC